MVDGISIRRSANRDGINYTTLRCYLEKKKKNYDMPFSSRLWSPFIDEEKEYIEGTPAIPDSWHRNKMTGIDWLKGLLKRRRDLSIRQSEACSLSRLPSYNKPNVGKVFQSLKIFLTRYPGILQNCRIYYLDETTTTTIYIPKKKEIIRKRGEAAQFSH